MFISSYRVTKFAAQNFWRNFWLSLITISMLVLTLLTVNILVFTNVITDRAIGFVEDRIEVSVYFHDYATDTSVTSAVEYLRSLSQVRDVETITADEAYDQFVTRHAGDEQILSSIEELDSNPFGPTLVVKAYAAEDFELIIDALDNPQFSDQIREKDFSNYETLIERINDATDRIRAFGVVLSAIFLLIALLIVFNTVRISIFIHREEIGIMRLVGASNWFIKAPFLLEMMMLSFVAMGVTVGVMYPVVALIEPQFNIYFGSESVGLVQYFAQNGLTIFGLEFLALVVITMISTSLAMRKYLKV
ncbi:ABC transporter permease [Candidatus Uhrbacteria bacterium]|jgi:cell division transport system permease protein|nr:ABC transporter permease [Candidatus Uhrbacteria bacterium]